MATGKPVRSIDVSPVETPSPEVIAARIDLGCASYHELCCPFAMYAADESMFDGMPACTCGGPAMAMAYAEGGR